MFSKLTQRQKDVLPLIALGYSNRQIAEKLKISISTVKAHIQEILYVLNVKNRVQAASIAASLLNINPDDVVKVANRVKY